MNRISRLYSKISAGLIPLLFFLTILPAEAVLPNGAQDVYNIFTTGNGTKITGTDYDSFVKYNGAYLSWSSSDFLLSYDGGPVGNDSSGMGIMLEDDSFPPRGAWLTYRTGGSGTDGRMHWMKVSANNTTLGSFVLTGLNFENPDMDTYSVRIIGTKLAGGSIVVGPTSYIISAYDGVPTSPDLTAFAGQQITSFTMEFTCTSANLRPADFTFQNFTIASAMAPLPAPTVTTISPASGVPEGGTSVTITGTNFSYATAVKFGSTDASSYVIDSNTQITATAPAGSGTVHVTVTTAGGTSATSAADQFTYVSAPTVTSQAVSAIASTSATGNGTITATGGANATTRGVIYYAYTNTDKVIGDGGVTDISETGSFGNGAFTAALTPLAVNTQYNARAYATSPNGTGYGARVAFWTLANVPSAPTVNNAAATSLDVTVNVNGNPAGTEFAIQETSTGNYVQAGGTLGAGQVWQTAAAWGTKTVPGLTTGSTYTFQVKARNGGSTETAFGTTASGVPVSAPTVTSQAASAIAATSATGNGTITATGGANATTRGVIYYAYTDTDKVIGDGGVTNVSETGSFGTGAFTAPLTPLAVNTQYNARAYATSPNGTGYGARVAFWTLANVPSAPTVNNAAATSLDVTVNVNGNPAGTEFAIQETSTGNYVQAGGTLGAGQVWQTAAAWGTKTVPGLTTGSTYTFQVKARNGGLTETGYGATASGVPISVTVTGINPGSGPVAGGTPVSITGTNFTGATGVTIGGTAATSVSVVSATSITATTPAGTAGARDVIVTTPLGSGTGVGLFTYIATPVATAASSITFSGFTANWNSATGATGYYLDVATDNGFSSMVSGYSSLDVGNVTSKAVTGLNASTSYYYRLRAYNTGGTSDNSNTIPLTTGTTRIVTIVADSGAGSLRDTIAGANPGDAITFDAGLNGQTITLSSQITIDKDITINGPGAANLTISGGGSVRIFEINAGKTVQIAGLTLASGSWFDGPALFNRGILTVSNVLITGNHAVASSGSGIYNETGATLTVSGCTITGNIADAFGGGVYNNIGSTATISNTTITGNTASTGSGIYNNLLSNLTVENSTISGNSAVGVYNDDTAMIRNSILWGNGGSEIYNGDTITVTNSIVQGGYAGAGNLNVDPLLGPLANNGGPTQTMALLPGSSAINAGNDSVCAASPVNSLDQRGITRPQGLHCDIGAYEFVPGTTTAVTSSLNPSVYNQSVTFTATVSDSEPASVPTGTVTFKDGLGDIVGCVGVTLISGSADCTLSTLSVGGHSITAEYTSDSSFSDSISDALIQTVNAADQSTLTVVAGSPLTYNTTETLSATGGSGTGAVSYEVTAGSCTITGDQLKATSGTGSCSVRATKAADTTYNAATSAEVVVTLQRADQTALVLSAGSPLTYNTTETLSTTGGSGTGVVSYQTTGSCTITGDQLKAMSGTGTCSVTAIKALDDNYNAATSIAVEVTLQKASQTALALNAGSPLGYNATETLSTTGGSGTGAVSYEVTAGSCTVLGDQLKATSGTGTCTVTATKAGDTGYNPVTSNPVTVTLQKANQATLNVVAPSDLTIGSTATLSSTGGSGTGDVTYSAGASTGCLVTGTTLSVTDVSGSCSVTASKAADSNYNAATSAAATVALHPLNTISGIVVAGNGSIVCTPSDVIYGGSFTCTLCPSMGYDLYRLYDNSVNRTGSCSVDANCYSYSLDNVTSNHTVKVNYSNCPVLTISGGNSDCQPSITPAIVSVQSGDRILARAITFVEDVDFNRAGRVLFLLEGGYDPGFSSPIGQSIIRGSVTISDGVVVIEDIIIW